MKADNNSLTESDREDLKNASFQLFMKPSHQDFIKHLLAIANLENMKLIFEGYQSPPKHYTYQGVEIVMWNSNGTYHTPVFLKEKYRYHVILEFPENLTKIIGRGSLVIELEVVMGEESDNAYVEYSEGSKYKFHNEEKTWEAAEIHCQNEGGHLASILSEEEQQEVKVVASGQDAWIGGFAKEAVGSWKWSDGSPWQFSRWDEVLYEGARSCVQLVSGDLWNDEYCLDKKGFICQSKAFRASQTKNITKKYNKENLIFSSFEVWFRYNQSRQTFPNQKLNSNERRLTPGFRLTWKIEPPQNVQEDDGESVLLYESLAQLLGNKSLLVQIEVDTREEKWRQFVNNLLNSSKPFFQLYNNAKTWDAAKTHCQSEGGHLASILSEDEQEEVKNVSSGIKHIWLGGSDEDQEGVWRWTDGSPWGFTRKTFYASRGDSYNCLELFRGDAWRDYMCTKTAYFVCKFQTVKLKIENNSVSLEFTKAQLNFVAFTDLKTSLENIKPDNLEISCFLKDNKGNIRKPTIPAWTLQPAIPRYQDDQIVKMIDLASKLNAKNLTIDEVLEKALKGKQNFIETELFKYTTMCAGGQLRAGKYDSIVEDMNFDLFEDSKEAPVTEEDIQTGFMIYAVIIYCKESVALHQFLHNLLSTQSPRTIIQTTVNTIEFHQFKENVNKDNANEFYLALDRIFDLQFGKILLGILSQEQLERMISKGRPYFYKFESEIDNCLNGVTCKELWEIIQNMGKIDSMN